MRLFKKKLAGYVADNPNLRWEGNYKVKYKGMWIIAKWGKWEQGSWYWELANGDIFVCDDDFEDINEKRMA